MRRENRRKAVLLAMIGVALIVALVLALRGRQQKRQAWEPAAEGFLAVATPCCYRASLWRSLDDVSADGQRARAATPAEAADWLNTWPYRSREKDTDFEEEELSLAAQSNEVRCVGRPTGDPVPRRGDDVETLEALQKRRECSFAKWKIWSGDTAKQRPHERHTVWVDELDRYHGRVDYWR